MYNFIFLCIQVGVKKNKLLRLNNTHLKLKKCKIHVVEKYKVLGVNIWTMHIFIFIILTTKLNSKIMDVFRFFGSSLVFSFYGVYSELFKFVCTCHTLVKFLLFVFDFLGEFGFQHF